MSQAVTPPGSPWSPRRILGLALLLTLAGAAGYVATTRWGPISATPAVAQEVPSGEDDKPKDADNDPPRFAKAEELDGGTAWLNTAGPIRLKDLRGKFVLLDFWTYCCINCIHTLPDLAKLEKKYANQLVVIGVHSAKFDNEKDSAAIRKAILRYEITHPVVNDSEMKIWRKYHVHSW